MPATGSILLDTSVVVAALRRVEGVKERLQSAEQLWLPLFVLGELEYGVSRSSNPTKQSEALSALMEGVVLLSPGEATAKEYGLIKLNWRALARRFRKTISGSQRRPGNTIWLWRRAMTTSNGSAA